MPQRNWFSIYAWFVVIYNIGVILWGAVVRATGSGAGCGNHWPSCNGEIIPRPEAVETVIELTHRATSVVAGLLVIFLVIWAYRRIGAHRFNKRIALLSLLVIILEGMLGALLVRFEFTADNDTPGRALVVALHLANTLFLLGVLVLTAWSAGHEYPQRVPRGNRRLVALLLVALLALVVTSSAGAVTALGDTLFPVEVVNASLLDGVDLQSHFLVQLRIWHPLISIAISAYIAALIWWLGRARPDDPRVRRTIDAIWVLLVAQIAGGFLNIALSAPVWMQILHLLLADALWIALVLLSAEVLYPVRAEAPAPVDADADAGPLPAIA
jgi:heme A synthase